MSFGGKSFKREQLRLKQELQSLTRQSKSEFVGLNSDEKSKLLESSSKTLLTQRNQPTKRQPPKRTTKSKRKTTKNLDVENNDSDGEIPPPSPSIDLGSELRTITPDSEIITKTAQEVDLQDCDGVDRKNSDLISRSTGVASIRSKVELNVVMYGKGLGEENSSIAKQKDKVNIFFIINKLNCTCACVHKYTQIANVWNFLNQFYFYFS